MKTIYITEEQKRKIMLAESAADRAVNSYIREYTTPYFQQMMDTPLRELPDMIQRILNPGDEGESGLFTSVADHPDGKNTFFDYLRANFLQQFGLTYNNGIKKYIKGIARIAITELGFYSFGSEMQGGKIMNLGKLMNRICNRENLFHEMGLQLDGNLNGFSYDELIEYTKPFIEKFMEVTNSELDSSEYSDSHEYTVFEVKDHLVGGYNTRMFVPTEESKLHLAMLKNYTDWCICGQKGQFEYGQYTSDGGKFYILEKRGFEDIPKEQGENCPLDEYGLSLISVIVGLDGEPDNITTRWNHDFDGENVPGLQTSVDLQRLTGINYRATFKPRSEEDAGRLSVHEEKVPTAQDQVHNKVNAGIMDGITAGGAMEEGAEPGGPDVFMLGPEKSMDLNPYYHVNESSKGSEFEENFKKIAEFMEKSGLQVSPFPKVHLDWSEQDGLFIKTGFYSPEEKAITVFCKDRHPKDILRTFAHEMIHHSQNLRGINLTFTSNDDVKDNKELERVEAEAYLKGNIYFRKWTEYENSEKKSLNESKTILNDEGEVVPDNCTCGGKIGTYICGEPIYKCSKCGKYYGTVKFGLDESKVFDDTDPEDVDLSSFNIKRELNPKFWKNNLLDSRIRLKLMDIADDFIEFLGVDWVKPDDVIMTGSLANFNWNDKYSDIDLHVLMDFSKVDSRTDFVKKYFDSLKNLWNDEHEGLNIFGFPVEVYVQDTNEAHASTGVYSLDKNEWLTEPKRDTLAKAKVNKHLIKSKVAKYMDNVDELIDLYKKYKKDNHKIEIIAHKANKLWDTIKNERKGELNKGKSEISNGNIVFKSLRRLGYLDKLYKLKTQTYDNLNSLP